MKRLSTLVACLFTVLLLAGADGCASDPNVEGAKLDLRNKDYDRALENVNTALEKNPQNANALELKGRILMAQAEEITDPAEHEQAIRDMVEAFNAAVEADPTMADAVTLQLRNAYLQEFQRGVQAYNRGQNNAEEFNVAAGYFGNAGMIQPDSAGAFVNQAYSYVGAQNMDAAMTSLETAVEKGDSQADTYLYLASLYLQGGREADAVTLLERARDMMPDNPDVQQQLLQAYVTAGQSDRAVEYYSQAVQREPDNALYRYNYGSLLLQTEQYEGAVQQLIEAVRLDPENPNAQYNLGAAYINQAVNVNDMVREKDDALREARSSLSQDEIRQREAELDRLVEQRTELFRQAITPLEKAREIAELNGENDDAVAQACRALFQAYTNARETEKAQAVADCAGYGDTN